MAALGGRPPPRPRLLRELAKNGAVAVPSNGTVLKQVAGGQKMYGVLVEFMALTPSPGARRGFRLPKEGVSAITEPIAILKTAKHPEAAQALSTSSSREQARTRREARLPARAHRRDAAIRLSEAGDVTLLPLDMAKTLKGVGAMRIASASSSAAERVTCRGSGSSRHCQRASARSRTRRVVGAVGAAPFLRLIAEALASRRAGRGAGGRRAPGSPPSAPWRRDSPARPSPWCWAAPSRC